jgi:hypothetical protein
MSHIIDGTLGVDLTATVAGTGTSSDEGDDFPLGTVVRANDGAYMRVHAAGAIAQYDCVAISEAYEAAAVTKALVDDGHQIGFAQVAVADNAFAFVLIGNGVGSVNVLASCAADVVLYTSATAGKLDDTSTSQTQVAGVVITTTATASTQAEECIVTSPRSITF